MPVGALSAPRCGGHVVRAEGGRKNIRAQLVVQADSKYAIDTYTSWMDAHRRRGWKTSTGAPTKNRDLLEQTVARGALPGVTMTHVEATYLAWLDISALGLKGAHAFFEQHGLGFSDGAPFGATPDTHVRLNFGCTRATLTEALARMLRALAAR